MHILLTIVIALSLSGCAVHKNPKYTTAYCDNMKNIMFDKSKGGNVEMFKEWSYNCVDYSKVGSSGRKSYDVRVHNYNTGKNYHYRVRRY